MTCHHLSLARVKQKTSFSLFYCLRFLFAPPARVTSGDKYQLLLGWGSGLLGFAICRGLDFHGR